MKIDKIFIASDHAGFELKEYVKTTLSTFGDVVDLGTSDAKTSVDYPDYAHEMAKRLRESENFYGVLICGTGIGISIAANRHEGVRAALCHDSQTAKLAREHNNANVLAFGARINSKQGANEMIEAFFMTEFAGGRHLARVEKIEPREI